MKKDHETARKFIDETLKLIVEKGGSTDVNLREISKRIGCAHTSAYNYFENYQDLMWSAFEEALKMYAHAITHNLHNRMNGYEYYTCLINNLIHFGLEHPGLYRFISTDPINAKELPDHIITMVVAMKKYVIDVIATLSMGKIDNTEVLNLTDILIAYIDGETTAIVTDRFLPGEDIYTRILSNCIRIFTLFTSTSSNGIDLKMVRKEDLGKDYPELTI